MHDRVGISPMNPLIDWNSLNFATKSELNRDYEISRHKENGHQKEKVLKNSQKNLLP